MQAWIIAVMMGSGRQAGRPKPKLEIGSVVAFGKLDSNGDIPWEIRGALARCVRPKAINIDEETMRLSLSPTPGEYGDSQRYMGCGFRSIPEAYFPQVADRCRERLL